MLVPTMQALAVAALGFFAIASIGNWARSASVQEAS